MDFTALKENFEKMKEQIDSARTEMREKSPMFIEEACKQFFEECPEVEAVVWNQFTPYFNDGESCEFQVHDKFFILTEDEDYDMFEGSVVYSEDDLVCAYQALSQAQEYTNDSVAWVENYKKGYKEKYGYECYTFRGRNEPKPYPSNPAEAQEKIDEINQFFQKYGQEFANRIEEAFYSLNVHLNMIDIDTMQALYGDHVRITITRTGTDVEDYHHD